MLYKGSQKIQDTGSYGVYKGSQPIGAIYHGTDKVYLFHRKFTWQAGTTLAVYKVSPWCSKIQVDCVASKGWTGGNTAGKGGRVRCKLNVTPNQILYITVGKIPTSGGASYNASDIRTNNAGVTDTTSLQSRLVVAGGGGSSASSGLNTPGAGGQGGGLTGGRGGDGAVCSGAEGGTQSTGGSRGGSSAAYPHYGSNGTFGLGGAGYDGGAGGAGWYGGGGGSGGGAVYSFVCSGGGGGSSYTNSTLCSNVTHTQGYRDGAGYITITEIG